MDTPRTGLCGWELNNPDSTLFHTRIMEVCGSCRDCEHLGECLVPSESMRCLIPREGQLIELHRERAEDEKILVYFALIHKGGLKFIQLSESEHYWAKASCINREEVPNMGLFMLERELTKEGDDFPFVS